jgi:hypothetical protein
MMSAISKSLPIFIGILIAIAALYGYGREVIVPEDFALRADDFRTHEEISGVPYTATTAESMSVAAKHYSGHGNILLWLGNSQLHTINQKAETDHLAPFWLRESLLPLQDVVPLGFSLPNANLQEFLVIEAFVTEHEKPSALILQLVFDDLREDDLRAEFSSILSKSVREKLDRTAIGKDVLARFDGAAQTSRPGASALEGFVQRHVEDELNTRLANASLLWSSRPNLRAKIATDLYYLRNAVFRIKPTSVRRMIPIRYERNMRALQQILTDAASLKIPTVAYIAPLRPDVPAPYDPQQYERWKIELHELTEKFGVILLDLDGLVPGPEWGTYHQDDIDFMHFTGSGHERVARALDPIISKYLSVNRAFQYH